MRETGTFFRRAPADEDSEIKEDAKPTLAGESPAAAASGERATAPVAPWPAASLSAAAALFARSLERGGWFSCDGGGADDGEGATAEAGALPLPPPPRSLVASADEIIILLDIGLPLLRRGGADDGEGASEEKEEEAAAREEDAAEECCCCSSEPHDTMLQPCVHFFLLRLSCRFSRLRRLFSCLFVYLSFSVIRFSNARANLPG